MERPSGPTPKAKKPLRAAKAANSHQPPPSRDIDILRNAKAKLSVSQHDSASRPSLPSSLREPAKTAIEILEELPADARPVFERLQAVRFQIAKEENVPAYIVFDNKTLHQMALYRPRSLEELQRLRGIGPVKSQKYGPRFVAAIADAKLLEPHHIEGDLPATDERSSGAISVL